MSASPQNKRLVIIEVLLQIGVKSGGRRHAEARLNLLIVPLVVLSGLTIQQGVTASRKFCVTNYHNSQLQKIGTSLHSGGSSMARILGIACCVGLMSVAIWAQAPQNP